MGWYRCECRGKAVLNEQRGPLEARRRESMTMFLVNFSDVSDEVADAR